MLENFIGSFKNTPFESPKGFLVLTQPLSDSWPSILSEHVYEANAIQVQTCIYSSSNVLLSAGKKLVIKAINMGIRLIGTEDESKTKELLEK